MTNYRLKWDATGSMVVLDSSVGPTTLQYSVTAATNGLVAGNSYSFIVIATNVVGDSSDSSTLAGIVAATVPTVPLNLIRNGLVTPTDTSITISWDVPASNGGTPITNYKVYWDIGAGGLPATLLTTTSSTTKFYTATGLTRARNYIFKVLATNIVGSGPATSQITLICAKAPAVPTNIVRLTFDS